jgi:hypothetical protein
MARVEKAGNRLALEQLQNPRYTRFGLIAWSPSVILPETRSVHMCRNGTAFEQPNKGVSGQAEG